MVLRPVNVITALGALLAAAQAGVTPPRF